MLMIDYRSLAWWYWLVTVILLTAGLAGHTAAFLVAICLTVIQLIHFSVRENSITAFPVQVRVGYFALLVISLPESMHWLYWLPCIGTWAQIIFGYCLMARTVSLLPWNRDAPLSFDLIKRTLFAAPVRGDIRQGLPPM